MADKEIINRLPPLEQELDGRALRVAIIHTRWNQVIVSGLIEGCLKSLRKHRVFEKNVHFFSVPGPFELPYSASFFQPSFFFFLIHFLLVLSICFLKLFFFLLDRI